MRNLIQRAWRDDSAQETAEYALLLLLLAGGLVFSVTELGEQISNVLRRIFLD